MTLKVDLYQTSIEVLLYKTGARSSVTGDQPVDTRYATQPSVIDLTPMLGDTGSVNTTKSTSEPAGGFTVSLTNQVYVTGDSLYNSIEPMDIVVIKMTRGGAYGGPKVVMRGFVSKVRRSEAIGQDGRPTQAIVVSGQDFGKLWQLVQVVPLADKILDAGRQIFSNPVLLRYGLEGASTLTVEEFIQGAIDGALNPALNRISALPGPSRVPAELKLECLVKNERVSIPGVGVDQSRTVYELLKKFTDVGVWNEMFVEDREDGVYVVIRPRPTIDLASGKLIGYEATAAAAAPAPDAAAPAVAEKPPIDRKNLETELEAKRSEFRKTNELWSQGERAVQTDKAEYEKHMAAADAATDPAVKASETEAAAKFQYDWAAKSAELKAMYDPDYQRLKGEIAAIEKILRDNPEPAAPVEAAKPPAPKASDANAPEKLGGVIDVLDIPASQVVKLDSERSDEGVANFYWVDSARMGLNNVPLTKVFDAQKDKETTDLRQYHNAQVAIYGDREMVTIVSTCPGQSTKGTSGNPEDVVEEETDSWIEHLRKRRRVLSLSNRDNVILESGSLEIMGRPDIRAGVYLRIVRGGTAYMVYAQSVSHQYRPFDVFTTTIRYERGDQFARHLKATAGSYHKDRRS